MKGGVSIKSDAHSLNKWVNLFSIVPIIISTEIMWLSLAPVSSQAEHFYGVNSLAIAWFSLSYMIMFIVFSLPASWVIDKWGYRTSLIIGAVITALFGLLRFIFAENFTMVLITQFIIAIGQPFLLNISTKVAANWFAVSERSTATGILTMGQYIGFVIPMVVAPSVAERSGISNMFLVFAIIAIVSAAIAILFTKEKPHTYRDDSLTHLEVLRFAALKSLFTNKRYFLILLISFISIGIFNTILTLLETILKPRGFTSVEAGIVGAVFIIAGIIGALILPILSDILKVRVPFFIGAIALLIPAFLGLTFISNYILVSIIAGLTGFIIMGVAPILFQHGSEVAYPTPEGTSLGTILLMGQISGAAFVYIFESLTASFGSIVWPMLIFVLLTIFLLPFTFQIKESPATTEDSNMSHFS